MSAAKYYCALLAAAKYAQTTSLRLSRTRILTLVEMGRGGDGSHRRTRRTAERSPAAPPPFTLKELRNAVPPHCFQRSLLRSGAYLAADCLGAALVYYAATGINGSLQPEYAKALLWVFYALVQGTLCTGIWVIAHECGHGAFSEHCLLNDALGLVLHSALLVPYFSWKFSHARHHAGTGSLSRDEVFVPPTAAQAREQAAWKATAPGRALLLAATLTLGWPLYLVKNAGSSKYAGKHADHFWPWSPVFLNSRERALVALSDVSLLLVFYGLRCAAQAHGIAFLMRVYIAPYLVVNAWLVTITLLQHTHRALPHFSGAEWNWLRGACSTMDRDYGWMLNTLHHHIADTHVCHHIFSAMPHYHAVEATQALRRVMGPYAPRDDGNVFRALWRDWCDCAYVDGDQGASPDVQWYRSGAPAKSQ